MRFGNSIDYIHHYTDDNDDHNDVGMVVEHNKIVDSTDRKYNHADMSHISCHDTEIIQLIRTIKLFNS